MLILTQRIDIIPNGRKKEFWLNQYDEDFIIRFELFSSEGTFSIPSGTTAAIRGTKPDGNGYSADAVIDGNTVTVEGDQQITVAAGKAVFELTLYKDGKELNSANFILHIERAPLDKDTPSSRSQTRELVDIEDHADELIQAATDINDKVSDSEAYAIGTRDGSAVASDDPAYHNNSKFYAESLTGDLAPAFSESAAYTTGDYVIKDGKLYKFTADHAAGAWTGTDAAEAQLAGDVSGLKEDLSEIEENFLYDKTTLTAWEKGVWSSSDGTASPTDVYIRHTDGFVSDKVVRIKVNNSYLMAVFAWNKSDGTYVGILQGDGTFAKNGSTSKAVAFFDPTSYPAYKFKVCVARNPVSSSIAVSEGDNCIFYSPKEEDKGDLSEYSGLVCSGNYSVGDTVFDNTTVSAGDRLFYKTKLNEASSASGSAGYVALYDASDNRIACFGTLAIEQAKINEVRFGAIVVPEGFSYAKWAGNKPGTIEYISKYMTPEYFDTYYGTKDVDLLKNPAYATGLSYNPNTKTQVASNGIGLTSYIPVAPNGKITLTKHLHGKSFGHAFYDANLALVEQYASVQNANDILVIDIPENAYYVRFSFLISTMADAHAYYEAPPIDKLLPEYVLNPYVRRTIKGYGQYYLDKEFTHVMAASICYFANKKILAYRCGYMHDSRTDSSLYGYTQIDAIAPDGELSHIAQYKASDFGCAGDARDPFLGVSKDGKFLLLLIPYNRGTAASPTNDCALVCLDQTLSVVDYVKVVSNVYRFTYGTPLITPTGHIIFNAYTGDNKQYVYRSNEVFSGTVSNLTFTDALVLTTSDTSNEACMGYHNGKLYMLIRCDTANGKIIWTDDLEGVSGWSSPVSVGASIHSPRLLPHYNGEYIPFVASWFDQGATGTRKPALGYINVDTESQTAEVVGIGIFDNTLDEASNNGYPAFILLGGEHYAVTYYQEDATNTYSGQHQQTGLYYKYVNAREVIPNAVYFMN